MSLEWLGMLKGILQSKLALLLLVTLTKTLTWWRMKLKELVQRRKDHSSDYPQEPGAEGIDWDVLIVCRNTRSYLWRDASQVNID